MRIFREGHHTSNQPLIEVSGLCKQFKGSNAFAVSDVSFTAEKGEIIGLIGENGAGKSTLMRMLSTMLTPTGGSARICGFDVSADPRAVRSRVGILFGQAGGLYERLTARENILYFAGLNGMDRGTACRRIEEISTMLQMADFLDRRAGTFSTGMRQKTLIARSIIHDPSLLLLDEPASGLDVTSSRNVHRFIQGYRDLGKTILFSSHDIHAIEAVSDKVLVLHKGRVRGWGSMEHLKDILSETRNRKASLESAFFAMLEASS